MKQLQETGNPTICPHIVIVKDGWILLGLRHYKKKDWKTVSVWTTPGGRCDAGEKVETTLRREVAEEIGVTDLEISDFLGIVPGAKEGDISYLFAGTISEEPKLMEPEKTSEWRWTPLSDFPVNFINKRSAQLIKDFMKKNYNQS
jgi:ADP-ribose pyrophosphatase YjhB (NUDIX family)